MYFHILANVAGLQKNFISGLSLLSNFCLPWSSLPSSLLFLSIEFLLVLIVAV